MVLWTSPIRPPGLGGGASLPRTRSGSSKCDALAAGSTERGALLRREGLYTSHIAEWRNARDAGAREGLAPKAKPRRSAEQVELEWLRRKAERLEAELERTKTANKLSETQRQHILAVLRSEEYCDLAPAQVWARLIDDGI